MAVWMQASSGRSIDLLDPDLSSIFVEDIANALAKICRFTGHTVGDEIYSVAQHSCLVASLLPDHLKFRGLMHDAHEAYIGDISTPVKSLLGDPMKALDIKWMRAIADRFGFVHEDEHTPAIHHADRTALAYEHLHFLAKSAAPWSCDHLASAPLAFDLSPWSVSRARKEFLHAYSAYRKSASCSAPTTT